ncbi:MAG: hypothetical protein ACR65W_07510 [Methylocystis sp.]|uniref:hypothetical protein n=1 Tax=Methylocystis sp. TaxID=1911079 RepID=UPI003DA34A5B
MTETEANVRKFLRRADAGDYIKEKYGFCSGKTLAKLACEGGGPNYFRAGNVALYTREELDKWVLAKIGSQRASTAEHGVRQPPSETRMSRVEALAREIEAERTEGRAP